MCVALACPAVRAAAPDDAAEPSRLPRDSFVDDDGSLRSFRATYDASARAGRRETHYLRAAVEMGVLLSIGTTYYWANPGPNRTDWDYPDAATRMSNLAPTYDTNYFITNHVLHPAAGSLYYWFARSNGLKILPALGYSIITSAMFEFGLEWLEKPSINDLVMTPMGGLSAGEFFLHAGDYFNSAPNARWYHRVVGAVLGAPQALHRAMDGGRGREVAKLPEDRLGFSSFYHHRFDVLFGAMGLQNDRGASTAFGSLRIAGELVAMPGFLRPGRFEHKFSDGNFTEGLLQIGTRGGAEHTWDLSFDANLFGRYAQDIGPRGGHASMIAINSAMKFADREVFGRREQYAMAHLIGPAVKLWAVAGDFTARFEAAANFDFAAVRTHAYPEWTSRFGSDGTSTVLRQKQYFYGGGLSARARGRVSYKFLELGTRVFFGRYDSSDHFDRFPDEVTRTVHASDTVGELEGWLGIVPRNFPFQLRAFAEHLPHWSEMGSVRVYRWDRRYGLAIGALF